MAEVVRGATVSVWAGAEFLGSGFFIEPHLVVTCAHVVWRRPDRVVVRWRGHDLAGEVVVRAPAERGDGEFYAHPDVAIVRVTAAPDHPVARLAGDLTVPPELFAYGFSLDTPNGFDEHTLRLTVVGRSGQFLRLKDDEIADGMSGAPALDVRTGLVYGIVKGSRDYAAPRGGWIVQATDVALVRSGHASALGPPAGPARPRIRPKPGSPLHDLLVAQCRAAERLPYRLVDGPSPALSTIYVRQRAAPRYAGPGTDVPVRSVAEVLRRHRHTLVVGGPGAGKSALVQHIVGETATWWLDAEGEAPAPYGPALAVRVPATAMLGRRPWLELLAGAVERDLSDYLDRPVDPETLDPAVLPGVEWLLLVDGLDEVFDRDERQRLIGVLGHRVAEYGSSWRFLVTSRPLFGRELAGLGAHLPDLSAEPRFGDYELRQFDRPGLERFAGSWFAARTPRRARGNADAFLDEVDHRQLDPLVRMPLLATIAAVVFEDRPQGPLPMSRTGLYERFVTNLVYARQRRQDLHRALSEQLAVYGPAATRLVDLLFDRTQEWLEEVAHRRLEAGEETATTTLAHDWLRQQAGPAPDVPDLPRHLRAMLLGTGLLTVAGDDLRFIHRGFAEYLAAGYNVRAEWDTRQWLRRVRRDGVTNLDMFRLARWADAGNDPAPVLRRLLRIRLDPRPPFVRRPQLLDFCAVLRDGLPLPDGSVDRLLAAGFAAVRRLKVVDEAALPALTYALRSLHARSTGPERLTRLALDRRVAPIKRIAAARALVLTGTEGNRRVAVDALAAILAGSRPDDAGGLWAAYTLALIGDAADRERAIGHLSTAVAAAGAPESRVRAAVFLTELGHGPTADRQLLVHAVSPARTPAQRIEAIETLRLVGPAGAGAPMTERLADVRQHLWAAGLSRPGGLARPSAMAEVLSVGVGDLLWLADGAARLAGRDPDGTRRILAAARAEGGLTDGAAGYLTDALTSQGHGRVADALARSAGPDLPPDRPASTAPELAARAVDWMLDPDQRLDAITELEAIGEAGTAAWLTLAWHTDPLVPVLFKVMAAVDLARHRGEYGVAFDLLRAHSGDRDLPRGQRLVARFGAVALKLDTLTAAVNGLPPARRLPPLTTVNGAAGARLRAWLRSSGDRDDALAHAIAAASSPAVAGEILAALLPAVDETPAPQAPAGAELAAAQRAMDDRAETLRIAAPAGMAHPDWTDHRLEASIGPTAARVARAALARLVADPHDARRAERHVRRSPARACPWYARLLRELDETDGPDHAARLALAVALREAAERYPRPRRLRVPPPGAWRAALSVAGRDARSLALAVAAAYAATYVGAAAVLVAGGEALAPPLATRIAAVQSQLVLPVLVVMGCLLLRPARSFVAARRARWAAWAAGGVAALLARPGAAELRVPASDTVRDILNRAGGFVLDALPATARPALAVAAAGIGWPSSPRTCH
ncbi:serine protease [Phytohabitans rumicis]|uniref:NACHT domain-containing protein n=1 Tax=Phytohabitans rumicis TaxID=1076125 RepID=A0A6V8LI59_9ACTN|nr:serine protease [Phytohabitans rumicis]GFJ95240.1 hypothetical protein Prum_088820 [Phytohabitans rumicis]